ncbi:MAG: peptidylprolyl isomerase [Capnocytophaga sp.]|nr:peptidylprolyl isomerase [Capnocytophaga sp.]
MKKIGLLALALPLVFSSCKSKYPNLKDGLYADIQTNKGDMLIELYYDATPITVANFVSLAEGKNTYVVDSLKGKPYYNGTIFHRVIKDFMIQGGDRTATGAGSPGYQFADEFVDTLQFTKKGQLAMANAGPATNGSQFFITQVPTAWLTGMHTIFGQVVQGEAVIDTIAAVKTTNDKPEAPIRINKVEIIRKGKNAESFNAVRVFDDFMKKETEQAKLKEEKNKALTAKFLNEIQNQEQTATAYPSGIKIFQLAKGTDQKPTHQDNVLVKYAGFLKSDGMLFDSNMLQVAQEYGIYDKRRELGGGYEAFPIPYNQSAQLIPGFKEALLSMNVGDKIRVFIPSALAYGENGAGNIIPPNADLIFDIEITGIAK